MSYTKLLILQAAAQEAYDAGELSRQQYANLLDDLSQNLVKVDYKKSNNDFKELILFYAK